jgi:predicted nucleic acid-binding protein
VKIVLDTNVLVSGIFFTGPPSKILRAWSRGKVQLVVTPEILDEYRRVVIELHDKFPGVEVGPIPVLWPLARILLSAAINTCSRCRVIEESTSYHHEDLSTDTLLTKGEFRSRSNHRLKLTARLG